MSLVHALEMAHSVRDASHLVLSSTELQSEVYHTSIHSRTSDSFLELCSKLSHGGSKKISSHLFVEIYKWDMNPLWLNKICILGQFTQY